MNVTKEWFKEHGFDVLEFTDKIIAEKAEYLFNKRINHFRFDYVFPKESGDTGYYMLYAINYTSNIKVECGISELPFSVATIEGILNLINMNY